MQPEPQVSRNKPPPAGSISRSSASVIRHMGKGGRDTMPTSMGQQMAQLPRRPADVRILVAELQAQATRLLEFSKAMEKKTVRKDLRGYRDLQRKVMEFDSFSAVIETQLIDIRFRGKDDLRKRFDDITLVILSALVGAKLRYLSTFRDRAIPFGTKALFQKELAAIRQAADRLTDPKHRAKLSADAGNNIKLAENVLEDIVARSVDLPAF